MKLLLFVMLLVAYKLDVGPDPVTDFLVLDVHELDSNLSTVGILVGLNQLSQLPLGFLEDDGATEW